MASPYGARACGHCKTTVPPQKIGQPRKYCSDECRTDAYNARRRAQRGPRTTPLEARLSQKLQPVAATGCVEFTGYRNEHGYGVILGENGKTALAHRAAWTIHHGAVPDGLCVCHKCDNPSCCNVEHLFLGTHLENMRDRDRKGRTLKGAALRRARWGR